jgi:TnpA family transposase
MIEGAVRHGTTMELGGNYVDSHGQTEIGFAVALLLGFDLLPRIKQINKARLYQPDRGDPDAYPQLKPAMMRPIHWELIEQNYDMLVKYATAIRVGTASTVRWPSIPVRSAASVTMSISGIWPQRSRMLSSGAAG